MYNGMIALQRHEYVLCSCCLFFKRTSHVRKSNNTVGRIIKDLNKENKALFGNLIESRSERRKILKNEDCSLSGDVNVDIQRVFPKSDKLANKSSELSAEFWPRSEVRFVKATNPDSEEGTTHKIKLDATLHDSGKILAEQCPSSTVNVSDSISDTLSFNNDKIVSLKSSTVLPTVILKNIDKYPMINKDKNILTTYSLKSFDSSCISNKKTSRIYPSVTKILNATMSESSKMLLKKWREKMVALLGREGFLKFYQDQLNGGIQFHTAVQSFLRGTPAEDLRLDGQGVEGCWKSLASVIPNVEDVRVLEGPVLHSDLLYHGVMDCVAVYQGEAVLIEWKKSDKPKPTLQKTFDAPLQLSAYIGAMNFDKNYPIQIKGGLVVVAYSDGSPAEAFHLDLPECYTYWKYWLQRLRSFWNQHYESEAVSKNPQEPE